MIKHSPYALLTLTLLLVSGLFVAGDARAQTPNGMVSLAFDDGWASQYDNALPILEAAGFESTFYIISDTLIPGRHPGYMTASEVQALSDAGHEIGGHSVTHTDLTTLSEEEAQAELVDSKEILEDLTGQEVSTFAYPFGAYDAQAVDLVQEAGYKNARTVDDGYNTSDTNRYLLKAISPTIDTPLSEIKAQIDEAMESGTWLIISLHQIDYSGAQYSHTPEDLQEIVDYLLDNNITQVTIGQGVARLDGLSEEEPELPETPDTDEEEEEGDPEPLPGEDEDEQPGEDGDEGEEEQDENENDEEDNGESDDENDGEKQDDEESDNEGDEEENDNEGGYEENDGDEHEEEYNDDSKRRFEVKKRYFELRERSKDRHEERKLRLRSEVNLR